MIRSRMPPRQGATAHDANAQHRETPRQPVWKAVALVAAVAGAVAASCAAAYDAVVRAGTESGWRALLGPLGSISIGTALAALVLGLLVFPSRYARIGYAAAAPGAITGAYWIWVMKGVLETT